MVPEFDFSMQRQWFPKNCDKNTVWHSQKLKLRKFLFLVPLLLKRKWYSKNELKLANPHKIASSPLLLWYDFFVMGFPFLFLFFLCFNSEQALSESRMRVHFTAPLSTVALAMFQWCGYRRARQPHYFPNGYADRKVTTRGDKNGLFLRVQ